MKHEHLIDVDAHIRLLELKRKGKLPIGLTIDVPDFDRYIVFKRGNFNMLAGHANVGKTTVTLWLMMVYAMRHGIKWLIFSSENNAWTLIEKLCSMYAGISIDRLDDIKFYQARDFVTEHFKFINDAESYTAYELLDAAKSIRDAWEFDGLMIDPYNSLKKDKSKLSGLSTHDYDYEVATDLRLFCKKEKVTINLCAHGQTEALRKLHGKDDEFQGNNLEGHPRPLSMSDVEGGGKWGARVDDFYVIHRYNRHETLYNKTLVHVNKIKETETGGAPTFYNEPIVLQMKSGSSFLVSGLYDALHPSGKSIPVSNIDSDTSTLF